MVPSIGPPKPYRERQSQAPGTTNTASKTSMESRPLPSPPAQDKISMATTDYIERRFSPLPPTPNESGENSSPSPVVRPIPPSSESPESRPISYYSTVANDEAAEGLYSSVMNNEELEMLRRQQVSGSELPVTIHRHSSSSSNAPEPSSNNTPPPTEARDEVCTPQVQVIMTPVLLY